jgi:alanine racemase
MARPTRAEINLPALRNNIAHARSLAPGSKLMAVVKANAYGHGALTIATEADSLVDAFAVASIEEAIELRDGGVNSPILLLEGIFDSSELKEATERKLWLTVANEVQLGWIEDAAHNKTSMAQMPHCWLKVNTGMNRLGVPADAAVGFYNRLKASGDEPPVLYTHFACADNLKSNTTEQQINRFEALAIDAPRSAANSAGLLAWPGSHYDWVRPGYMLYGNSPLEQTHPSADALRPVMTLKSKVIAVNEIDAGSAVGYGAAFVSERDSRIATVAVGYADGYPRNSEVTLWGDGLTINEIAQHTGTLGYEITTRMPSRPPRIIT